MDIMDYRYADHGKAGKREYVYFYVREPLSGKLMRKRIYLNYIKSRTNRRRYARKLIQVINNKLDSGWNPFIDDSESKKKYTPIKDAFKFVIDYKSKFVRPRSKGQYEQRIRLLTEWLERNGKKDIYVFDFKDNMAIDFMNELLISNNIKSITFNNYLIDYCTLFNTLIKQKYLITNPFHAIDKLPEEEAEKRYFTPQEQRKYVDYIKNNNYDFYILSQYTYYCALRPKEITELKIQHFDLEKGLIYIPGNISKNRHKGVIPIAKSFLEELRRYFKEYPKDYYICSKGFMPGLQKISSVRIGEKFREIANNLNFPMEVKFYSLKDTAAERLIENGFNAKQIRDLFRHSSLSMTDKYMKKIAGVFDEKIINDFPEF